MKIMGTLSLRKRENGIYYIGYEVNGKLHWKTTKCTAKQDALQFLRNFNAEEFKPTREILLSELFTELEQSKRLTKNTLGSYETAVNLLKKACGDKPVSQYELKDLEYFKQAQLVRTVSHSSINIWIRSLVAVLSFAVKRQYILKNPFSLSLTIQIPKKPPLYISQQEFELLLTKVPHLTLKDISIVAANTGMRLNELLNLKWQSVSLEKKQIGVVNTADFRTKSGRSRIAPMNELVFEILSRRHSKRSRTDYVFTKSTGCKYEQNFVSHGFKKYVRDAELNDEYHFHTLRHSFAPWLALKEVPIFSIQQLLGHASVNTTLQYAHLSSSVLHGAVNRI